MLEVKTYKNGKGTWTIVLSYKDESSNVCLGVGEDFETYAEAQKQIKITQEKINKSKLNDEDISINELNKTKVNKLIEK